MSIKTDIPTPKELLIKAVLELEYDYNWYEISDNAQTSFGIDAQSLSREEFVKQCVIALSSTTTFEQVIMRAIDDLEMAYENITTRDFYNYKDLLDSCIISYLNEKAKKYLKEDYTIIVCQDKILVTFRGTFIKMERKNREKIVLFDFNDFMTHVLEKMGDIIEPNVRADYLEVYCLFNTVVVELNYEDLERRE